VRIAIFASELLRLSSRRRREPRAPREEDFDVTVVIRRDSIVGLRLHVGMSMCAVMSRRDSIVGLQLSPSPREDFDVRRRDPRRFGQRQVRIAIFASELLRLSSRQDSIRHELPPSPREEFDVRRRRSPTAGVST
jgi:hypothetical protein